LDTKINVINDSENEFEFLLPYSEIKSDIESEVKKQINKIQIDGFRKGKAPISVIKRIYGDALDYTASEKVSSKIFYNYVKVNNIPMLSEPVMTHIDFKPEGELNFKIKCEIIPKLENLIYKDLDIEVLNFKMKNEEVDAEISKLLNSNAEYSDSELVSDEKHQIMVNLQRIDDKGNIVEGIKQDGLKINLTDKNVNRNIVDGAMNKKVGDVFHFSFKDEHVHEHNGEHHHEEFFYNAEIKEIKKIDLPELTDEFVKKITRDKIATVDELRDKIKKQIEEEYDRLNTQYLIGTLKSKIVEMNPFIPPYSLVEKQLDGLVKDEIEYAKKNRQKIPSANELRDQLKKRAEETVKVFIIENKIKEREQLNLSEEFIKSLAEKNAVKMGVSVETLIVHYKNDSMKDQLIYEEIYDFIIKNNNLKEISPDDLKAKKEKEHEHKN
jgi:trigger factor